MNKYNKDVYKVSYELANSLIESNIMIADSGNFETGERHFILNVDYSMTKLNRIEFLIQNIKSHSRGYIFEFLYDKLIYELNIIKLKELRKSKLNKLNENR